VFQYPKTKLTPDWLLQFNQMAESQTFNRGQFGIAFDVWRDKEHLFSSYTREQSESLESWCERNYPDIEHPDYANCAMGAGPGIGGVERFPIPTWLAIDHGYSLNACQLILQAAIATAAYPTLKVKPPQQVPNPNALRQRMHNWHRDWMRLLIASPEDGIVLRAILARSSWRPPEAPQAIWDVSLYERPAPRLQADLTPWWGEIEAPQCDLTDVEGRKATIKAAKKAAKLSGIPGRVTHEEPNYLVYSLDHHPYNLGIKHKSDIAIPPASRRTGFFNL
jgi:hypothetical protein